MRHAIEDVEYAEYLFDRFYGIGSCESGGVSPGSANTEVEDEMHRALCALGEEKGYGHFRPTMWATPTCTVRGIAWTSPIGWSARTWIR